MILGKFKHIMYKSKAAKPIFDLTFIKKINISKIK